MVEQITPVFLFVFLGYAFKRIKHDISEALTEFVIYFSLPALALSKIRKLEFNDEIFNVILIAYIAMGIASVLAYGAGRVMKLNKRDLATVMIVSIFGNTAFVGFSYVESLYSLDHVVYALVYDQMASFIALLTFGVVIIAWGGGQERGVKEVAKQMFFSPPLLAIVAAIYFQGTVFPSFIETMLDKFQATLIPLVTTIVGMKLDFRAMPLYFKENLVALSIKMLITPLLMLFYFVYFADLKTDAMQITFLEVAMPPMTMAVVLAIRGGLNKDLAINALALGILFSFLSITLWHKLIL
ncbi:AEC family transporter [Sulfurospirillum barnesii]|uniref:Putative permease n=1 Tax=Sulfurospirillum barnesii (strain ATCC 700032 / DSM 10660 / SES-3) TaxID=760154 RepID=I3XYF6_SULBS|nr:AEC family transporter [Sulfurospirillum barnesii]AFL68980.1 putative permease [Sulfurospirillum barnesii SES-3]